MRDKRLEHNEYQRALFTKEVDTFCEQIPGVIQQRLGEIVEKVQLERSDRVLDVGTGTGVLIPLIKSFGVEQVVGCDLSSAMLSVAADLHQVTSLWCGDVLDLPDNLGPFDVVFLNAVFGNLWDQMGTLCRVNDVLKEDGRVCISHPLGSRFVVELHRTDSRRTPHILPDQEELLRMVYELPLQLTHYQDEEELYIAVLLKTEERSMLGRH